MAKRVVWTNTAKKARKEIRIPDEKKRLQYLRKETLKIIPEKNSVACFASLFGHADKF